MKIQEIIHKVKKYHRGIFEGRKINDINCRDQILYGKKFCEDNCTGIVTTCWASSDVIRKAQLLHANLIICHEALFWNHGDKRQWLIRDKNKTFESKMKLLRRSKIVIWRDHDYMHSGILDKEGNWRDGIYFGLAHELGWEKYMSPLGKTIHPIYFELPFQTTARNVAHLLISKLQLNGARIIGNPNTPVRKVEIPNHAFGKDEKEIINANDKNVDLELAMELVDYSLCEYIRDSSQLGQKKAMIAIGHFNMEEPGMKYMLNWLPHLLKENIPITFVKAGDTYHYIAES